MALDIDPEQKLEVIKSVEEWHYYYNGQTPTPNLQTTTPEDQTLGPESQEEPKDKRGFGVSLERTYLSEIGRIPLLTPEQEIALAQQRDRGKAAYNQLVLDGELSPLTRSRLEKEIREGEAAIKHLIEANLRLVVSVARRYLGRGLEFQDLVQEGNIGLTTAVQKFEWEKGFRFSTYAYWWIRQAITRAIADQGQIIRKPVHAYEEYGRLLKVARDLEQQLGRRPTSRELASGYGVDVERVEMLVEVFRQPTDLFKPLGDEDRVLADVIPDETQVEQLVLDGKGQATIRDIVFEGLEVLTDQEKGIIIAFFGLDGTDQKTLAKTGLAFGVSRERIRQIKDIALAKLRRHNWNLQIIWEDGLETLPPSKRLPTPPVYNPNDFRIVTETPILESPKLERSESDLTPKEKQFVYLHAALNPEKTDWRFPDYEDLVAIFRPECLSGDPAANQRFFDSYDQTYLEKVKSVVTKLSAAREIELKSPESLSSSYKGILLNLSKQHGLNLRLGHLIGILEGEYDGTEGLQRLRKDFNIV